MKRVLICLVVGAVLSRPSFAQEKADETSPKTVRLGGVELHYVERGTGVAVVLVHGGLEDYRSWQPEMEGFSQRYRTIAYSRRHNYPNRAVEAGSDYSALVDAEDLAALITTLELGPAHVVGLSHGAYTAMLLAIRHPTLVRSLVLCEAPILRWLPELEGGKALFTEFMSKAWEPTVRGFRESDEAGVTAAIGGFSALGYFGADVKVTFADLPQEVQKVLLENAPEWRALTASKDAFPYVAPSAVKGIEKPVLLLSGARSLALHGLIDRQLEKVLPRSEHVVIPDATHQMWSEHPEECQNATLVFLARH
jgi:pimeloyl-ACP methyl ester carboxylesterase